MGRTIRTTSGSSVYFEDTGTGPEILALHGVGGGAYFFRGVAERIGGHRVVAIDLPGTGRSVPSPADFTLESWVADLHEVADAVFDRPFIVLGHSLGTMLAMEIWRRRPDRVRALIFAGGLPEVRVPIRERLAARARAVVLCETLNGWGEKISPGIFSPSALAARPEVVGLFERVFDAQAPAAYARSLDILLATNTSSLVPRLTAPVFAVTGADDQYAPPAAVQAFLSTLPRPADPVTIPDCAHMPFFEQPDAFAAVLRTFLAAC